MMIKFEFENNVVHGPWSFIIDKSCTTLSFLVEKCCEGSSPIEINRVHAVMKPLGWVATDHV